MNLQHELNRPRVIGENARLWEDGRVWWVNCVAVESAWANDVASEFRSAARRERDLMLAALIQAWT